MKAMLLAVCLSLILVAGLAQAQKSPPYDPKTGVYTIDFDDPPKAKKGESSTSSKETKPQPAQPTFKPVYPPGYWEKQEQLQRREVAEYERRYRERQKAEAVAIAREEVAKRLEEKQEDAKQKKREERDEERGRSKRSGPSELVNSNNSRGAVNPVTGEFYAPAGGGNLVGTRDGTLYTPAGPSGYINTRTDQFVPAH